MLTNIKLPSEKKIYQDEKSGREIIQLTQSGSNWHFYFTDNSFTKDSDEIFYWHKEDSLNEKGRRNLFKVNIKTGERVKLTNFERYFECIGSASKTTDSEYLVFVGDNNLYVLNLITGDYRLLMHCPEGYDLGQLSISHDKKYVAICVNESISQEYINKVLKGSTSFNKNYCGFTEHMYAHKTSYLYIACMDGSGAEKVFQDTHWIGHVQFAPDSNEYITFCHEGPWNYVQQRIWMFNTITRRVKPCYRQAENDSVGHEFWTSDGLVFFDNRGPGHDGTITSDKTQATIMDKNAEEAIPLVGFADKDCNILKTVELPYYCNHYHANNDHSLIVADAVEDIVLMDISGDEPTIESLSVHNTSWTWQQVHCHPTWSWDNEYILYASDKDKVGYPQLYAIKMK